MFRVFCTIGKDIIMGLLSSEIEKVVNRLSLGLSVFVVAELLVFCHYFWWPTLFLNNSWWMWIIICIGVLFAFAIIWFLINLICSLLVD